MSETTLVGEADVVVIGGGIGGCSVAYHLAKCGVCRVVLLERATLSCGTTWHSTGNMETYREDALMYAMVRYGVESMAQIQSETAQEIGWRNVGRVMFTDNEARMETIRAMPEIGRVLGIEVETLTPEGVAKRLPIIDPTALLGGVWIPSDARLNPTDLVMALAKAARRRDVSIREQVTVKEISVQNGRICGVVTDTGTIECNTVVVAAGLWSNEVVASCGLRLPLYALEHQYLITEPIPGVTPQLPLFLSYDDQLYGREEVGGLIVGSLDDEAIPLGPNELPANFSFALLNERWSQFEPYMTRAMRRFPVLATAGVKMLLNGPESFTPDGRMLLGPIPGVRGLYACCGFNSNGIALAPAAGRFIAEWIVEGAASADVTALDVRRFSPVQSAETYMRERVTEIPGYLSRLHETVDDFQTARGIRVSPLHHSLTELGARFTSVNGWERVAWVAPSAEDRDWMGAVAAEVSAARDRALVIDRSADFKLILPDSAAVLRGSVPLSLSPSQPRQVRWIPLRGHAGITEALTRVIALSSDSYLLLASPEQDTRVKEWLRLGDPVGAVAARDATVDYALLEIYGPGGDKLLNELLAAVGDDAGATAYTGSRSPVSHFEDPLADSILLLVRVDRAIEVWESLLSIGSMLGLRAGGFFAEEALRVARGLPRFGRELTPGVRVRNVFPESSKPPQANDRTLVALSSGALVAGFGSEEPVLHGQRIVGRVSSRVGLPNSSETLLLALLSDDSGLTDLKVQIHGNQIPVALRTSAVAHLLSGSNTTNCSIR